MYWLTSSFFSLGQILLLKVPAVRTGFGIPTTVNDPSATDNSLFKTNDNDSTTSGRKTSESVVAAFKKSK